MCQGGAISQALKRTYALQFTLDRFRLLNPTTNPSATMSRIDAGPWTSRFSLRTSAMIIFPPHLHMELWQKLQAADQSNTTLFPEITSNQLQDIFPAHDTNWEELIGANNIVNMVSFAGSAPTLTSHEAAICEYIIVILSGSAVASWTTKELYQKLISEKAYA